MGVVVSPRERLRLSPVPDPSARDRCPIRRHGGRRTVADPSEPVGGVTVPNLSPPRSDPRTRRHGCACHLSPIPSPRLPRPILSAPIPPRSVALSPRSVAASEPVAPSPDPVGGVTVGTVADPNATGTA